MVLAFESHIPVTARVVRGRQEYVLLVRGEENQNTPVRVLDTPQPKKNSLALGGSMNLAAARSSEGCFPDCWLWCWLLLAHRDGDRER